VLAVDLPGFGGSTPTGGPLSIADHATAVGEALDELSDQYASPSFMPIGFHTGSGVGGELALLRPDLISRVAFVTYPYLDPEARQKELESWASPPPLPSQLDDLASRWDFTVGGRADGVSLDNAFDLFAEQLRAADRFWHGFVAMFRYPAEERLGDIEQPVLVINPPDVLHSMTAAAAALMRSPTVIEPDYGKKAIFELFPDRLAEEISAFAAQ
jgi:pimeloyl-ACP methyl ester carboxylesterase